jgi:cytochrome c-type biogenesis protein CcmH/NrfG
MLRQARGEVSEAVARPPGIDGDRAHVASCPGCKTAVEGMVAAEMKIQDAIRNIRQGSRPVEGCPSDDELLDVAAGLLSDERARPITQHAAACAHCGPLLREFLEDMAPPGEQTVAEIAAIASPEWQREVAHRLAGPAPAPEVKRRRLPAWIFGLATAAVAAIVAGVIAWPAWQLHLANEMTLEAYADKRQIDFQLPGAPYAPIHRERGASIASSPALAEAESLTASGVEAHPGDPKWLAARGRVELVGLDYSRAIEDLEAAAPKLPNASGVQIDLAAAYFLRGQAKQSNADFEKAYDLLSGVIQTQPNNAIAIFNRALTAQALKKTDQASADWERYLQLNPSGPAADEARRLRSN